MKLSTRSRYGTRLVLDMARHYGKGPVQLKAIARRQNISAKYLEQLIIPLKKANYVKSVRGSKGGHILAKSPEEITVGEIVSLLEGGPKIIECITKSEACERSETCPTRLIWKEAAESLFEKLNSVTFSQLAQMGKCEEDKLAEIERLKKSELTDISG